MTTKVQRGMLWGALFLFALLGGGVLGRFVTGGLAGGGQMLAGDNAAANFWEQQDRAHNASAPMPANAAAAQGGSDAHICEGCDASSLRRQSGDPSFHYDPQAADTTTAAGAAALPAPPATSTHP